MTAINMHSERMPLGDGFTVSFTFRDQKLEADWQPRLPYGRKGRKYLPAYKRARDEFIARLARRTGLTVLVVDL
ncbi:MULTISPECIES: hypothetical protein [unclassified Sphingomonas]|uniref:hypothetical protein n=1 Tax=unclassified Sphingomonas TaxID=196159 RepID=UPI00226AA33F|nr:MULTISPECIES: hypothetical protein [unclassified Sphingomonas]